MQVSVIIPTYNEAENIPIIVPGIAAVLEANNLQAEIIVVDDNSPDGTAEAVEDLRDRFDVKVIKRNSKRGLAQSVIEGFENACGEICVVMDADLSHPIETLPEMIKPILNGQYQATVGSRYIAGGGSTNWSFIRKVISRGAGLLAKGLNKLSDPTSGFMAIRRELLENHIFEPIGWKIVLEVITKTNAHFKEVPIIFADRINGESKLDYRVQLLYMFHLYKLYDFKIPTLTQFIRFCFVGFSGLVIDTLVLTGCVEIFGLGKTISSAYSFLAAATSNFFLNRSFTFRQEKSLSKKGTAKHWASFLSVCLFGLILRVTLMHLLISYTFFGKGRLYIFANFIGIIAATFVNFFGSKKVVFKN